MKKLLIISIPIPIPIAIGIGIGILTVLFSCKKEVPEPEPCVGCYKEVFQCKIDGVDFTPSCKSGLLGCSAIDCQFYEGSGTIELVVFNDRSNLKVSLKGRLIMIGVNGIRTRRKAFQNWNNEKGCVFYDYDTLDHGILNIVDIDTIKQIIKGEFEYDVINYCGDTVSITEGYFDVVYRF